MVLEKCIINVLAVRNLLEEFLGSLAWRIQNNVTKTHNFLQRFPEIYM